MKLAVRYWLVLAAALALFLSLPVACGDDDDDDTGDDDNDDNDDGPVVLDTGHGTCKDAKDDGDEAYPEGIDLQFTDGVLTVTHVNGVFNCCVERIDVEVALAGGVLSLTETEYAPEPCDCICPYDVVTRVEGPGGRHVHRHDLLVRGTARQRRHHDPVIPRPTRFGETRVCNIDSNARVRCHRRLSRPPGPSCLHLHGRGLEPHAVLGAATRPG